MGPGEDDDFTNGDEVLFTTHEGVSGLVGVRSVTSKGAMADTVIVAGVRDAVGDEDDYGTPVQTLAVVENNALLDPACGRVGNVTIAVKPPDPTDYNQIAFAESIGRVREARRKITETTDTLVLVEGNGYWTRD